MEWDLTIATGSLFMHQRLLLIYMLRFPSLFDPVAEKLTAESRERMEVEKCHWKSGVRRKHSSVVALISLQWLRFSGLEVVNWHLSPDSYTVQWFLYSQCTWPPFSAWSLRQFVTMTLLKLVPSQPISIPWHDIQSWLWRQCSQIEHSNRNILCKHKDA